MVVLKAVSCGRLRRNGVMREVDSAHPPGLIGVPCGDLTRYTRTHHVLSNVCVPKGSDLRYGVGVNVAHNCNNLVKEMLEGPFEWLWIMGDDHGFQDSLLLSLLDRDVDIVVPIVSRRGPPFQTVLYQYAALDGSAYMTFSWADLSRNHPQGGLIAVDAAGSGGMLIRRHVLETMTAPWFSWSEKISEDVNFCLKARIAGFAINADLDQRMTHLTPCELEPYRNDKGEWNVAAVIGGRRVSLTNTLHDGKDLREITYGYKPGMEGRMWETSPTVEGL